MGESEGVGGTSSNGVADTHPAISRLAAETREQFSEASRLELLQLAVHFRSHLVVNFCNSRRIFGGLSLGPFESGGAFSVLDFRDEWK